MQTLKFEQIPLFTGGHSLLTVELTLHLNGVKETTEVAYTIKSTASGEWVEGGTLGVLGGLFNVATLTEVLEELLIRARAELSPF